MLLHQTIRKIQAQHWVILISTDPTSKRDVKHFCAFLKHKLLMQSQIKRPDQQQKVFVYLIEKGLDSA